MSTLGIGSRFALEAWMSSAASGSAIPPVDASVKPALSIGSRFTLRLLAPASFRCDDHAPHPLTAPTPHHDTAGAASALLSSSSVAMSVPRSANRMGWGLRTTVL